MNLLYVEFGGKNCTKMYKNVQMFYEELLEQIICFDTNQQPNIRKTSHHSAVSKLLLFYLWNC